MPPHPSVTDEDLVRVLTGRGNILRDREGKIQGPSKQIWKDLAEELSIGDKSIQPKNIYTIVKLNRRNSWQILGWSQTEEQHPTIEDVLSEEQQSSESDLDCSLQRKEFDITLSAEEWRSIAPKTIHYKSSGHRNKLGHRAYNILQANKWTGLINAHFWDLTHLACCISYKRAKVMPSGVTYLKIQGRCTSCNSEFQGEMPDKPGEGCRAIIKCFLEGDFPQCGGGKRKLTGDARHAAISKMTDQNMSASMVRRSEAYHCMIPGDPEPSALPTTNALRIAKCRAIAVSRLDANAILAIQIMKDTRQFGDSIRDIGLDRFFVHYWSSTQIKVYNKYCKTNPHSVVSIDSTGSLVRRIKGQKRIQLYSIVVNDSKKNNQYPVGSMLSARHDAYSIAYFLNEWQRDGALCPSEAVTDMSVALVSAVVRSLGSFSSLEAYLKFCSEVIRTPDVKLMKPPCVLRLDVAHFIRMICKWTVLKGAGFRTRNFFIRSLAVVLQSTNIIDVRSLLLDIFTVALSPSEGVEATTGCDIPCEVSKKRLKDRIRGMPALTGIPEDEVQQLIEEGLQEDVDDLDQDSENTDSPFKSWVSSLSQAALEKVDEGGEGDHDNLQYLPKIVSEIVREGKYLPLWTAIMIPVFDMEDVSGETASSAPVESEMNDIKHRVFRHKNLPMRVDDFIQVHIVAMGGSASIIAASYRDLNEHHMQRKTGSDENDDDKEEEELEDEEDVNQPDENEHNDDGPEKIQKGCSGDEQSDKEYGDEGQGNREHAQPSERPESKKKEKTTRKESCPACMNKHFPTGAHKCINCNRPVHIFETCSLPVGGEEEGFGEKRLCIRCSEEKSSGEKQKEIQRKSARKRKVTFNPDFEYEKMKINSHEGSSNVEKELSAENTWQKRSPASARSRTRPLSSYLTPNPDIASMDFSKKELVEKKPALGLLKNGNSLQPVKIDDCTLLVHHEKVPSKAKNVQPLHLRSAQLIVRNTCAIDSFCQVLASAATDSSDFLSHVQSQIQDNDSSTSSIWHMIPDVMRKEIKAKTYQMRAQILAQYCMTRVLPENLYEVLAQTTAQEMLKNVLKHSPTVIEEHKCKAHCSGNNKKVTRASVCLNLEDADLSKLENEVLRYLLHGDIKCPKCNGKKIINVHLSPNHLIIELLLPVGELMAEDVPVRLCDIPRTITSQDQMYSLRGVIATPEQAKHQSMGNITHYYAICLRFGEHWEVYDDLKDKKYEVGQTRRIQCHLLIYTA